MSICFLFGSLATIGFIGLICLIGDAIERRGRAIDEWNDKARYSVYRCHMVSIPDHDEQESK
ncbi:MAG: hypothetical protein ACR2PS_05590 [Pseudomonadales bacterium]